LVVEDWFCDIDKLPLCSMTMLLMNPISGEDRKQ